MNKSKVIRKELERKGLSVASVDYLREPKTFKNVGYRVTLNDDSMPDETITFNTFDDAINWAKFSRVGFN